MGGAQATHLRAFQASSWGYHQTVIGFALGKDVPVVLVFLEQKMRGGGVDPVNGCQLLRDEIGHFLDGAALDDAAQILCAGDKIDGMNFGITVDALGDVIKADAACGRDLDINEGEDL